MPCEFDVKVVGKKGHLRWEMDHAHRIVCYTSYEPLSEDANREILKALAELIGISHSHVRLVAGVEDHVKRIKITDADIGLEDVLKALGMSQQEQQLEQYKTWH